MKLGAFDYITKPFSNQDLMIMVSRALEDRALRMEVRRLRGELARSYGLDNIIAANPRMVELLEQIQRVAENDASVLVPGESGTGKDLLARAIHFMSGYAKARSCRSTAPRFPRRCFESELFGRARRLHRRPPGQDRALRAARGGTLSSTKSARCRCSMQAKLLR